MSISTTPPAGTVRPKTAIDATYPSSNQALEPAGGRVVKYAGLDVVMAVFDTSFDGLFDALTHRTDTVDAAAVVPGQPQTDMRCSRKAAARGTQVVFTTVQTIPAARSKSCWVMDALNALLAVQRYLRVNAVIDWKRGGSMYCPTSRLPLRALFLDCFRILCKMISRVFLYF